MKFWISFREYSNTEAKKCIFFDRRPMPTTHHHPLFVSVFVLAGCVSIDVNVSVGRAVVVFVVWHWTRNWCAPLSKCVGRPSPSLPLPTRHQPTNQPPTHLPTRPSIVRHPSLSHTLHLISNFAPAPFFFCFPFICFYFIFFFFGFWYGGQVHWTFA